MKRETIMCEIFGFSIPTYYKRKREGNIAIEMIEKYFTVEDLKEYQKNKSIPKLENQRIINDYYNYMSEEVFGIIFKKETQLEILAYLYAHKSDYQDDKHSYLDELNLNYRLENFFKKLFEEKKIDIDKMIMFYQCKKNIGVFNFLFQNMANDWQPLLAAENLNHTWIINYFEFIKVLIEFNLFDLFFCKDPYEESIIIPSPPYEDSKTYEVDCGFYSAIIEVLIENIKNNKIEKYKEISLDKKYEEISFEIGNNIFSNWLKTIDKELI
jgi:hypothetical protein